MLPSNRLGHCILIYRCMRQVYPQGQLLKIIQWGMGLKTYHFIQLIKKVDHQYLSLKRSSQDPFRLMLPDFCGFKSASAMGGSFVKFILLGHRIYNQIMCVLS